MGQNESCIILSHIIYTRHYISKIRYNAVFSYLRCNEVAYFQSFKSNVLDSKMKGVIL